MSKEYRKIEFYENHFTDFYFSQTQKVKDKITWTLKLIESVEKIPEDYLKHIEGTNGLYEVRVKQGSNIFRIFSFFAKGKIIVLANGFQKKSQKTPKQEIEKALKIKEEYEKR